MDEKFKALATELSKALVSQNQDPEVYIASPFFDETSKTWVTAKEKELEGFRIPFFSPRQDGVNFNEEGLTPELRSERIKAIFSNNVRRLKECTRISCNLTPCNGKIDLGTLWELGFFIGYHEKNPFSKENSLDNTLAVSEDLRDLIISICDSLVGISVNDGAFDKEELPVLFFKNASVSKVENSIKLANLNFKPEEVATTISSVKAVDKKQSYTFLIDDYPFQLFMLMGWLYAKGVSYTTASFKGYGSNVMIAASSEGHINLPGLVDGTYSNNLK